MATHPFGQFVDILIQDDLNDKIHITNAHLDSGQFYKDYNRSSPIAPQDVDQMVVDPNCHTDVYCSGKEGSFSGAQGSIDLHAEARNERICTLFWSAPLGPGKRNDFTKLNQNLRYGVDLGNWNGAGTFGQVTVTVKENF